MNGASPQLTRILIVDADAGRRQELAERLAAENFEVADAADDAAALELIRGDRFDLLLTDLQRASSDGLRLFQDAHALHPNILGIVVAAEAAVPEALKVMQAGVFDYLARPFRFEQLLIVIHRAVQYQTLRNENVTLKKQLRQKYRFENIIGDSRAMQQVFRMVEKVADSDSTVLIRGESGTGKELIAQALHYASRRRERFLIPVNCGAIPETLLESELFGHVKGAFTGASTNRIGRFDAANGGTLFLDEIGDMSPTLQVKLLRVLQEQEFEPVGSTKTKKVDVRIIAATNRRLEDMVAEGGFREDLYYRLSVIPIHLPPLRERLDDLELLANHFLTYFCTQKNRRLDPLGPEILNAFRHHDWPGNVRELENLMERLVILAENEHITLDDLPEKFLQGKVAVMGETIDIPADGIDFNAMVGDFENKLIAAAITKARGNKNLAANLLGLKRTTLVEKIKKKQLDLDS